MADIERPESGPVVWVGASRPEKAVDGDFWDDGHIWWIKQDRAWEPRLALSENGRSGEAE